MLINKNVAIYTDNILLVPYSSHHVSKYHEWMKDTDIQAATASEPLTLDQEYAMQQSWRSDSDKLTFISCMPQKAEERAQVEHIDTIIGDVNLFILVNEEDSGELSLVGELELMIAEKQNQRRGLGKAALLVFVKYIMSHVAEILKEYFSQIRTIPKSSEFAYLRVKIGETNMRSINLFESLGFVKTEESPNFFEEWELRHSTLTKERTDQLMAKFHIQNYVEVHYPDQEDTNGQPFNPGGLNTISQGAVIPPAKQASSVDGKGLFEVPASSASG